MAWHPLSQGVELSSLLSQDYVIFYVVIFVFSFMFFMFLASTAEYRTDSLDVVPCAFYSLFWPLTWGLFFIVVVIIAIESLLDKRQ